MTETPWDWVETEDTDWVPVVPDTSRPSVARMYDFYLGGKDNFAVDREAAERVIQQIPDVRSIAVANRGFLARAVQYMTQHGIRQFLDLGSGLPTSPNTHETARVTRPDAVVAYVDNDPIVLAHNRARVARPAGTCTVGADIRQPSVVLNAPPIRELIDLREPVGVLMIAVLPFVDYSLAPLVVEQYVRALAPGSMVAISVLQVEEASAKRMSNTADVYRNSPTPLYPRTKAQTLELFDGLDLVEPGVVDVTAWHNDTAQGSVLAACGLGVKLPAG